MPATLTMIAGPRPGASYPLADGETTIGRGAECAIILADTLCSRVHAVMYRGNGGWRVRDAGSRNGTFVDGEPIEDLVLTDGRKLRIGSAEFVFHETGDGGFGGTANFGLTVVRDAPLDVPSLAPADAETASPDQVRLLGALYPLAMQLVGVRAADDVLIATLGWLRQHTTATTAGFLAHEDNVLRPHTFDPVEPADFRLSEAVTRLVSDEQHAVWLADEQLDASQAGGDALCIPVVHDSRVLGALYARLDRGRFRQSHFDLAIGAANMLAATLAHCRTNESAASATVFDTLDVSVWERRLIVEALRRTSGNVPEAACLLNLSRATLYRKIEDYGIER